MPPSEKATQEILSEAVLIQIFFINDDWHIRYIPFCRAFNSIDKKSPPNRFKFIEEADPTTPKVDFCFCGLPILGIHYFSICRICWNDRYFISFLYVCCLF